jgi:type IV pilus assembly protein PilC
MIAFIKGVSLKKIYLTNEEMADFFAELYILRQAQIPEKEALQIMAEGQDTKAMQLFLNTLSEAPSLISGLEQFPAIIPEYIIALLSKFKKDNSEIKVLEDIAEHLANLSLTYNGISYKQQVKSSFAYPIILLLFLFIVSAFMMIFVVPVFDDMFKGFGKELPPITQLFISVSELMQENWWKFAIGFIGIDQACRFFYSHSQKFRLFIERIILKIPIIQRLIITIESVAIIKTLSLLCSYQFSLAEALRLSATATQNTVFIVTLTETANNVANSDGLVDGLKQKQIFSAKTIRLLKVFEKTQQLQILNKLAQSYHKQIPRGLGVLLRILNIILLMGCWLIIGATVIAMYLPIFAMGEAAG